MPLGAVRIGRHLGEQNTAKGGSLRERVSQGFGVDDLSHHELAKLVREHLLAGHLIDRSGMPAVIPHGVEFMSSVAIDEWMGASPIYTKRTQRLLGFDEPTVEACFKAMQLDIGAPPEFLDFRFSVTDSHHGSFHLDHCGALIDVEPMGSEYVTAMCHHIEDPTFDATAWATNPRMRVRPVHRPPREPAGRVPHCAWTVTIDDSFEPTPRPAQLDRMLASQAARLPETVLLPADSSTANRADYSGPLEADLDLTSFTRATLLAIDDEVCLQGQLLAMSFFASVESRLGAEGAADALEQQFVGVAGVAAQRLRKAFEFGSGAADLAAVFRLHPAFRPSAYVDWRVEVEGDRVLLALEACPALAEPDLSNWASLLREGRDRALGAIAFGVDAHWVVERSGDQSWVVARRDTPSPEPVEIAITRFSTAADFSFSKLTARPEEK